MYKVIPAEVIYVLALSFLHMCMCDYACHLEPYGVAQRRVLCCNDTLYENREDGEECPEINIPYNPVKETRFHVLSEQHYCGTEVYLPETEICCDGHR